MTICLEGSAADSAIADLRRLARSTPLTADLGSDLLTTTRRQLAAAVGRPLAAVLAYGWCASTGHWILAALCVPVVFVCTVVVVHDLMHHSLGLSLAANSVLLGVLALFMLDSGHVLQATHRAHHRRFPGPDDPEGYLAEWPIWRVLLEGPTYRYRLWRWAWRNEPAVRRPIVVEVGAYLVVLASAVGLRRQLPELGVYVLIGMLGSWIFPLVSVTAVHDAAGSSVVQQSRTLRGRVVPALSLGMGYHLEHHLWPMIPAHHLGEAARRSEAILVKAGARITRVP